MPAPVQRCYPGRVLSSGHGQATAGAVIGRNGEMFVVTVGHYCDGHVGSEVEFKSDGQTFGLGRIEADRFLHDDTYDVGLIRAPTDRVGRVTLGITRLGDPYPFARLRDVDDLPCHFYLGNLGWRRGVIDRVEFDLSDKHRLFVVDNTGDGRAADFGHSGSPLYIRGNDGHEIVGLYVGRAGDGPLEFIHPGPGLSRLGFRLR